MAQARSIKTRIRDTLESSQSRSGRIFQGVIQVLIVLSIIGFTLETLPDMEPQYRRALRVFEVFVIMVFTVEYLLRIYVAERKLDFIFSFYGIIDLLVILPFYLQLGLDLRSLRVFWFLRLFRLMKLVRYVDAVKRMAEAFRMIRVDLAVFGIGALMVFYLASVGIYYFERDAQPEHFASVIHSFWWALATLTTVGYGDIYPVTFGGKLFTFFTLMIGLGVFAVPTGLITMAMVNTRKEDLDEEASEGGGDKEG